MKVVLFFLILTIVSCSSENTTEYCLSLKNKSEDPKVVGYMQSWVDQVSINEDLNKQDVVLGGLMAPGSYYIDADIDWSVLGFNSKFSQARLLGVKFGEPSENGLSGAKSIIFTEKSGYGIVIKLPESLDYGLGKKYEESFNPIAENVGVLCHDIDR